MTRNLELGELRTEYNEAMLSLADIPGSTLPERVTALLGEYLGAKLTLEDYRHTYGPVVSQLLLRPGGSTTVQGTTVRNGTSQTVTLEIGFAPGSRNGGNGMKPGDRVRYAIDGRVGTAVEFLQDGDASVLFDGDTHATQVKWNNLELEASPGERSLDHEPARVDQPSAPAPRGYWPAGATGADGAVFRAGDSCYWMEPTKKIGYIARVVSVSADGTACISCRPVGVHGQNLFVVPWEALVLRKRAVAR